MAGISAPFGSVAEADAAYYGEDGGGGGDGSGDGGGGGDDSGATWGELQQGEALGAGWSTAYQDQRNGDRTRWFVLRSSGGTLQFLNSQGQAVDAGENDTLSDVPHFSNEDDALAAFQAWADENPDEADENGEGDDESANWGEWSKVSEEPPWHIYSRSHKTEDRAQFLAASTLEDGSAVYLAPGGEVVDEQHVFDSADALTEALRQFYQRAEDGEIPEGRMPTGRDPGTSTVREQSASRTTSQSQVERLVERMGGKKVALAAVAVGGVALYQASEDGDLFNGNGGA